MAVADKERARQAGTGGPAENDGGTGCTTPDYTTESAPAQTPISTAVRQAPTPRGFRAPNYTQVPNDLLGHIHKGCDIPGLMANMNEVELKVVLALVRLTFGFHVDTARASLTKLQKLTGLSRPGVIEGAAAAVARGLFTKDTTRGVTLWRLVIDEDADRPTDEVVVAVDQPTDEVVNKINQATGEVVNKIDQSSKQILPPSIKETIKKESAAAGAAAAEPAPSPPSQSVKTQRRKSEPTPAAVEVFRQNAHRFPARSWHADIVKTVGDDPAALELWGRIVHAWVGLGWNPQNATGMLEFFARGEIPGEDRRERERPASGANVDADRQEAWQQKWAELEREGEERADARLKGGRNEEAKT